MRKRKIKLPVSDDVLVSEYLDDFKSTIVLAKQYSCGESTIARRLKENGVKIRTSGKPMLDFPKEFFQEEYINKKKTASQIARAIGKDHKFVTWRLNRFGIPLRPFGDSVSIGQKGKTISEKTKEALRKSRLGKPSPFKGIKKSPEFGKKISAAKMGKHIGWKHTEETRRKMSASAKGELNHNWRNGARQEKYCFKFNYRLKEEIREEFGRKCALCGASENGRKLDIHHTDFNKMQGCGNLRWNLVPLCNHCHGKTHNDRWYWFNALYCHWMVREDISLINLKWDHLV